MTMVLATKVVGTVQVAVLAAGVVAAFTVGSGTVSGAGPVLAGGSAFARTTTPWTTPEKAALAYGKAAAKTDCATLLAVLASNSPMRRGAKPADVCKRQAAAFHGLSVVSARRTSVTRGKASVAVRAKNAYGSFDITIQTASPAKNQWVVSAVS